MMGNETKTVRCSTDKPLPFDRLRQHLDAELEMNVMRGVIQIARENDYAFQLTYRNCDLATVTRIFQRICGRVYAGVKITVI